MVKVFMKTDYKQNDIAPLFEPLNQKIFGDIDSSMETIKKYSTDSSPFRIFPQVVIYPKNNQDIKEIIYFANEYNFPISVYGAGKSSSGGALTEGIIIDNTRYLNNISIEDRK